MRKRIVLYSNILLCALAIAVIAAAFPSSAAAAVEMKVRPGLGGLYKTEQPLELLITLRNSGPEFKESLSSTLAVFNTAPCDRFTLTGCGREWGALKAAFILKGRA